MKQERGTEEDDLGGAESSEQRRARRPSRSGRGMDSIVQHLRDEEAQREPPESESGRQS